MKIKQLTSQLSVSPQITSDDVAELAALGFKSVICNRPDGESADQPALADIESAVLAQGLEFRAIPFTSGRQTRTEIHEFGQALDEMPGPVLAFCRTGTRSAKIWAQSVAARQSVDEAIAAAASAGLDLSADRQMLEVGRD